MDREVPCHQCCYCKTGEVQYCLSPRKVTANTKVSCNKCCYCKTGEKQYCLYPQ